MHNRLILLILLITSIATGFANESPKSTADSLKLLCESVPTAKKKWLVSRVIEYFDDSNKPKEDKRFDFSVIGGPHYSSDTKFGIGLVAAGLYRTDTVKNASDYLTPQSDVSLYLDATTSMTFEIGIEGHHIAPRYRARLIYDVYFATISSKFWGIGYDNNVNDSNESDYKYVNPHAEACYVWRYAPNLYVGPCLTIDYISGRDFEKPWLWQGQDENTFNLGLGFTLQYDTRDYITSATKGMYIRIDQIFNPRFLLNDYAFSLTSLDFSYYHKAWRDATFALQFRSRFTYGNTPWGMLSTLGGSHNMRGYYEGRYRDKSEIDACLELRQHVWRRNGIVAWVGAGTVFPRLSDLKWNRILPNYGIGYRWEFKSHVNVRLDLGFGKGQSGFIFSINEAF